MNGSCIVQEERQRAESFLSAHGMLYRTLDPGQMLDGFLAEMELGLSGGASTLKMIPTYLRESGAPPAEKPVIVVDIGGTNVRIAVVTFRADGTPEMDSYAEYLTPGTDRDVDTRTFFSAIAEYLRPVIHRSGRIGFCFSFATMPLENRDARIIAGGKQLRVTDMLGKNVGESLRQALREAGLDDDKSVVVLNDSVAATLGGRAAGSDRRFSGYVGFIFGTGTNICYSEPCRPGGMIVNMESGGYGGFPAGDLDDRFDAGLIDVGLDRFEKMVSGRYQGGLLRTVLAQAAREGLLSAGFESRTELLASLTPREMDDFLNHPWGGGCLSRCCGGAEGDGDRRILCHLIAALTERSALLCAVTLSAALYRAGIGTDPCCPAFITAEGSTYSCSKNFSRRLDAWMHDIAREKLGISAEFFRVPNVTLTGTAVAGLSE